MSTHNIHFQDKTSDLELFHILIFAVMQTYFLGLEKEFKIAVVKSHQCSNHPSFSVDGFESSGWLGGRNGR